MLKQLLKEGDKVPFIEVKQGGSEIEDGVYTAVLTAISDPRTVTAQRGPRAGQDIDLIDWTFSIDDPGGRFDGQSIDVSSTTASGPKSKTFAYLTALQGGVAPSVGQRFEKGDLIGRSVIITVHKDGEGWPRIQSISAPPRSSQRQAPPPQPAPVPQPVAAATASDDLPF